MKLHDLPLSMRITGSAMILVALGALTLLFVEEAHLREVYFGHRRAHLEEALYANESRLTQAFATLRRDVRFLANTPPVFGIIRAGQNNGYDARDGNTLQQWEMRLQQILTPFLLAHPEYYQIACIESVGNGREIIRLLNRAGRVEAAPSGRLQAKAERDYYTASLRLPPGGVQLSEIGLPLGEDKAELSSLPAQTKLMPYGYKSGQPEVSVIHASVPLFDSNGQVFGLMVLGMRLHPLLQSTATNLPPGVSTYIADSRGRYLLTPDGQRDFRPEAASGAGIRRDFPDLAVMFAPHSPDFLPLRKTATQTDASHLTAGRVHYDPDNPAQFLLLAYSVSDRMARRFTAIPGKHIAAGFAILLLFCALVLHLLRRTFAPLKELTAAADAITAGTNNICLPAGSRGEIGSLTAALNAMLHELSRREQEIVRINEGLERQVIERTQELTALNDQMVIEIRERERILHEADDLLQRNRALMQTAMDGIHLLDTEGNLLEANPAFCRMLGYSEAEAIGLKVADWDARWPLEELRPRFRELIGKSVLIETVHRRKDGTTFEVEIACSGVEIAGQGYIYAASRDITGRKREEDALKQHRVIIETVRDGFWLNDMNGVLLEANEAYAKMSGYPVAELVGMHISQLEAQEQSQQEVMEHIKNLISQGYERFETRHRRKDGQEIEVEISVTYLPEAQRFFVFCHDISERKRAELALQHQRELLNEAQRLGKLGSWELDVPSDVLLWSDEVYRIFELDPARFKPSYEHFLRVLHPEDRKKVDRAYRRSLQTYRPYNIEHRLLFEDGRVKWVREHCTSTFDVSGRPLRSVGMVQDITEQKLAEEEIRALALHDQLTGLPNRRFFIERLHTALSASVRHDNQGALLFIDMDNFKSLNDTRGHEAGDLMLIEVAARLRASVRDIDTASRLGGDEFVVLIEELGNNYDEATHRAGLVAEKIRESLAQPYAINDYLHHSSPSIGVTLYRGTGESVDALLQHADTAMYQAKNSGRNKVCFFAPATQLDA
jgi:diguanylate cyclase (GGDEF)-like protein/PAS domain S-box-containing protein